MTSHVRQWFKWQRAGIATVLRNRVSRANNGKYDGEIFAPCAMQYVALDASLGANLNSEPLAKLGQFADAYITRTLCYVARTSALLGEISVTRQLFGPKVLSTDSRLVSVRKGGEVWDAFHDARFLVEGEAEIPDWVANITANLKDVMRDPIRIAMHTAMCDLIHSRARVPCSCSGSSSPPPPKGGDGDPSPDPEPPTVNGKPIRPRDRERLPRCLRYHAVVNRSLEAGRLRKALTAGELDDHAIADALRRFSVPATRLKSFEANP